MTNDQFDRCVENSVVPLFPYLADGPGKRMLLKVDSRLGRNGRDLILKAQFRGIYIYPGLPNAALRWKMAKTDDDNKQTEPTNIIPV